MPITLPPISRRRFLAGSLAVGASLLLDRYGLGQTTPPVDPNRIIVLSDTHIAANRVEMRDDANMADNLSRVVAAIAALDPLPAAVLINGDCARTLGTPEDYATFIALLEPVRKLGIPIHLSMGNHDHRDNLWKAIPSADRADKPVPDRQILRLEFASADWYVLDTLTKTNLTPGLLGQPQLDWLKTSLDARPNKPAVVMTHHHPQSANPGTKGIEDTQALLDILSPRKQVKSLLFGHTHTWQHLKHDDGTHWLNLPPTAYVFTKGKPIGWVDVSLADKAATMQLICLDEKHKSHKTKIEMEWRA